MASSPLDMDGLCLFPTGQIGQVQTVSPPTAIDLQRRIRVFCAVTEGGGIVVIGTVHIRLQQRPFCFFFFELKQKTMQGRRRKKRGLFLAITDDDDEL